MEERELEYLHHGDALVPRQQRFGGYTRAADEGARDPGRESLGPAPGGGATIPIGYAVPLTDRRRPATTRGWLEGVRQLQLPPAPAALRGDDRRRALASACWPGSRSICRGRIPSRTRANKEFNTLVWMPPGGGRAGDVLVADSTIFSTLFGGDESLKRFWKNIATAVPSDRARAGRHPEWVLRPRPISVRGDLHPAPHRRSRRPGGS